MSLHYKVPVNVSSKISSEFRAELHKIFDMVRTEVLLNTGNFDKSIPTGVTALLATNALLLQLLLEEIEGGKLLSFKQDLNFSSDSKSVFARSTSVPSSEGENLEGGIDHYDDHFKEFPIP